MPRDGTITKPDTEAAALLRKAKALIDTPEKWCQGAEAADKGGRLVRASSFEAVSRCSLGALIASGVNDKSDPIVMKLNTAAVMLGFDATENECVAANLNDTTDHSTVMAMFDLAIRLAKGEAA